MRILLIGPLWANAGHGAECGIFDGLKSLGHEVCAWDCRDKKYMDRFGNVVGFTGEAESKSFDVILIPGPGLPDPILQSTAFKTLKGPKVLWNSEPLRLPSYYRKVEAQKGIYDHTFTFDESEIFLYRRLGIEAKWLPQAFNPEWYKPIDTLRGNPQGIAFIGSMGGKWDNRNWIVSRMRDAKLPLGYGKTYDAVRVNEIYNRSKLVLNLGLHCEQSGPPEHLRAYGLQQRIFESIGAGRVCVTNEIPQGSNDVFSHGHDILFYSGENLEEIVELGLESPHRVRMEERILEIRHLHTYEARMKHLLEEVTA